MSPVVLGPEEEPAGRAFASPARARADLAVLRTMATALRRVVEGGLPPGVRPLALEVGIPGDPAHRIVVADETRLRTAPALSLVGFFGEKRPGVDHAPLTAADDALLAGLPRHPGILAYGSLELAGGNWGNLVVLDGRGVRDGWRGEAGHVHAAEVLAPRHYASVRLHFGELPTGLLGGGPVLTLTRYFDYRGPAPWRAERVFPTGPIP